MGCMTRMASLDRRGDSDLAGAEAGWRNVLQLMVLPGPGPNRMACLRDAAMQGLREAGGFRPLAGLREAINRRDAATNPCTDILGSRNGISVAGRVF
jgi:hypothetical protein